MTGFELPGLADDHRSALHEVVAEYEDVSKRLADPDAGAEADAVLEDGAKPRLSDLEATVMLTLIRRFRDMPVGSDFRLDRQKLMIVRAVGRSSTLMFKWLFPLWQRDDIPERERLADPMMAALQAGLEVRQCTIHDVLPPWVAEHHDTRQAFADPVAVLLGWLQTSGVCLWTLRSDQIGVSLAAGSFGRHALSRWLGDTSLQRWRSEHARRREHNVGRAADPPRALWDALDDDDGELWALVQRRLGAVEAIDGDIGYVAGLLKRLVSPQLWFRAGGGHLISMAVPLLPMLWAMAMAVGWGAPAAVAAVAGLCGALPAFLASRGLRRDGCGLLRGLALFAGRGGFRSAVLRPSLTITFKTLAFMLELAWDEARGVRTPSAAQRLFARVV